MYVKTYNFQEKNCLEKSSLCTVIIMASTASRTEDINGDRSLLIRTTTPYIYIE